MKKENLTNRLINLLIARDRGFTLIEMVVAIAVFSLIIVAIGRTFYSVIGAQRKIVAVQTTQEPARYLLESMVKEIRMGTINSGTATSTSLNIYNSNGENITYSFENGTLKRGVAVVSPSNTSVSGKFYIIGSADPQPKVTIVMSITPTNARPEYRTTLSLESTVSSRGY